MTMRRDGLRFPLLFGALAIAVGVVGRLAVDHDTPMVAGGTTGMLVWILAPAVLAVAFRRLDPETRHGRFFRLTRRTGIAAAVVAALAAAAFGVVMALGLAVGGLSFTLASVSPKTLLPTAASIAVFAFLEECAWRGYLLPSLLSRARYPVVIGVAALIWFAWHLPYLDRLNAAYTTEPVITLAPRLLAGMLALQFLYTELFLRSRSVWPAFALHATTNLLAQIAFLAGLALVGPWAWLFSPSADGVFIITVSAGVALLLYRRRVTGNGSFPVREQSVSSAART